jgi:hypothetical protein
MTTHTPPPWEVQEVVWLQDGSLLSDEEYHNDEGADYLVAVGTDDVYVALCWGDENARLIAVAPEMRSFIERTMCFVPVKEQDEARTLLARSLSG